jgi:thiamine monophosphate synthase
MLTRHRLPRLDNASLWRREKDTDGCCFLEKVKEAIAVARPAGVPVVVNDRADVALAAGADGVHIGQDDLPCHEVLRPRLMHMHATQSCIIRCGLHPLECC